MLPCNEQDEMLAFLTECEPNLKFTVIQTLRFQNTLFKAGEDVRLRDEQQKQFYGKILTIAQSPHSTFPLLLVAWYYSKSPEIDEDYQPCMGIKELILSDHRDWQYVESLKGKIQVMNLDSFLQLEPKERENRDIFYCRGIAEKDCEEVIRRTERKCHCYAEINPDLPLSACLICGTLFHHSCVQHDELCLFCQ